MKGEPTTYWAKLERGADGEVTEWHSLLDHSLDVALVLEALLESTVLRRRLARLLGWNDLEDGHVARLCVLAAIHDAGKVNNGFQARKTLEPVSSAGHVEPMVAAINSEMQDELLGALGVRDIMDWFETARRTDAIVDALCASFGHHGEPVPPRSARFDARLWKPTAANQPRAGLTLLAQACRDWFPGAFQDKWDRFPDVAAFRHAFNGVLSLADWLGSNRTFFPYTTDGEERSTTARSRAEDLLEKMHLDPSRARRMLGEKPLGFEEIADFEPYEVQRACMSLPISESGNLTILESDTGSGKTEAALARFIRLYQRGLVDGMYFAVPTRSAATQLHDRIRAALARIIPDEDARPPCVLAVPGYIRVDEIDGDPNALPGYEVQWPDDAPSPAERGWAAESSKRYLAGAVAVGTVDQVLMSALQVKHAHLRAAALARQFLVVDEVHSSDPYMQRILQKVLEHHLDAGGHALLMSATLGTADRHAYAEGAHAEAPALEAAIEEEYPLLTHVDVAERSARTTHAESSDYEKSVRVDTRPVADDPKRVARLALDLAGAGARVLVIRNLVDDCVATQRALESLADSTDQLFAPSGVIAPHHSRFAADDRRALDEAIEDSFGKDATGGATVVVATQTVEQSLDIDADILLTDLCPADVLLQRIGRLHRHPKRVRPEGFEAARCDILVPPTRDLSEAIVDSGKAEGSGLQGPHGLGTVYEDLRVLEATWRQLEEDDVWVIPADNRRLVERTTHPTKLEQIAEDAGPRWARHQLYIDGLRLGKRSHSDLVTLDRSTPFFKNGFTSDIGAIKTRLGNDDYTVEFEPSLPGPFGQTVQQLTVPQYWIGDALDADTLEPIDPVWDGERLTFGLASRHFVYDRLGLRRVERD